LVLAVGLLVATLVNPHLLGLLTSLLMDLGRWVVGWIMRLLHLLDGLLGKPDPLPLAPTGGIPQTTPSEWVNWLTLPDWVRDAGRFLVSMVWLGLLLAALWRVAFQILGWLRRRVDSEDAEEESLRGAFWEDLRALIRRLFLRVGWLGRLLRRWGRWEEAAPQVRSVRQIYRQLLRWGARAGHPRQSAQTPQEYLETLAAILPAGREDLTVITQQYVRARYGPWPPTRDEAERVHGRWRQVRRLRLKGVRQGDVERTIQSKEATGSHG
jgi:hypothetical protein